MIVRKMPDELVPVDIGFALCSAAMLLLAGCGPASSGQPKPNEAAAQDNLTAKQNKHLATLDDMDFNIFSNKQWNLIKESHADDIWVQNPDMTTTTGLAPHLKSMQAMAAFMPDMRITAHPVKIASGDWTGITATFKGTWTKPMPNPSGGAALPPSGKPFKATIATISHWRDGLMDKEWVFMDQADFARQVGLAPGRAASKGDVGLLPASNSDEGVSPKEMNRRLGVLDNMDFVVWSDQQWQRIPESHADNIVAVFPDGRVTKGIGPHINDMKQMFTWAPDARIREHPVKFGQGNWTVLIGVMEGSFTKPMVMPGIKPIAPTGKHFKVPMATYSHWNAAGKMDIEYVFWDNASWMKQIGVGA